MRADISAARRASTHKRRLLPLVFGGLLIGGFAGVFLWWQYYKTTPAYTVALLVDAARRNDTAALDRIIDMDKVVDNFVPEVVQKASGGYASDLATLLRRQLQSFAPGVMSSVKHLIREEIRRRINELAAHSAAKPFLLTALAMPYVANITKSGDKAKATIKGNDYQVELFMERYDDGQWRAISMRDDTLAARIVNNIVKDLPGTGSQVEQEIRRQLRGKLPATLPNFQLFSEK